MIVDRCQKSAAANKNKKHELKNTGPAKYTVIDTQTCCRRASGIGRRGPSITSRVTE